VIPTVLSGVGLDGKIEFLEMDPDGFDTLVFPELTFRVPKGWDRYRDRLIETFPYEEDAVRRCVGTLEGMAGELYSVEPPRGEDDFARFIAEAPNIVQWGLRTLSDLYDDCRLSERARAVIAAESGDYAAPPSRVAAAVHAGLMDHYVRGGAYYPRGGGQVFAAHLVDVIRSHGGTVRTGARVDRILVERGRVQGVELRGGETLSAQTVVSNADIKRTYQELLDPGTVSVEMLEKVSEYRMAMPLFCVYLGLDMDLTEHIPNTNFWCHGSFDSERFYQRCYDGQLPADLPAEEQFAYITSASVKDPYTEHIAPPGHSSIEVMTLVPPDYDVWDIDTGPAAGERYRRKRSYRSAKEQLMEKLIDRADMAIPGLKDHIVWKEAATPITQERYTLSSDGASYGLEFTPDQVGPNRPGPATEIEGLFLAGASTVWGHGITGAMRGGAGTASAVIGRDLYKEARSGRVFADVERLTAGGPGWDPLEASRRLQRKPRRARRPLEAAAAAQTA
jgi:all-trans-retinol 13,14-reductase